MADLEEGREADTVQNHPQTLGESIVRHMCKFKLFIYLKRNILFRRYDISMKIPALLPPESKCLLMPCGNPITLGNEFINFFDLYRVQSCARSSSGTLLIPTNNRYTSLGGISSNLLKN